MRHGCITLSQGCLRSAAGRTRCWGCLATLMQQHQQLLVLLLLLLLLRNVESAWQGRQQSRILAVPLLPTSPGLDMMAVVVKLRDRGHEVLVVTAASSTHFFKQAAERHSSYSSAESLKYLEVDLTPPSPGNSPHNPVRPGQVTHSRFAVPRFPRTLTAGLELELVIQDVVAQPCARLLQNNSILQALKDFRPDVVTAIGIPVPDTASDSCGCLLSHALGVPMIDIDCGMTFWSGPPSVPQFGSGLHPSDLLTATGFVQNLATWFIKQIATPVLTGLMPTAWSVIRDRLGLPRTPSGCPLIDAVKRLTGHPVKRCDVLLNAILGSWLVEYPRPLASHQVLLGPGTPHPAKTIQDVEVGAFLDGATSGLVLVGFGTSFQFNSWLSLSDYQELSAAFASLAPVRVLWNLNTQALPEFVDVPKLHLGSNTMLVPRIDYNDVLGHSNTRAFMSHCGIHSVYEAAYHGIPLVGVPFMFEQAESGARLAATGAAVMCQQAPAYRTGPATATSYTREHVRGLLQQVLQGEHYQQAAHKLAAVLQTQARNRHPYDSAADQVELAVDAWLVHHESPWNSTHNKNHVHSRGQAENVHQKGQPTSKQPGEAVAADVGAGCDGVKDGGVSCRAAEDHEDL